MLHSYASYLIYYELWNGQKTIFKFMYWIFAMIGLMIYRVAQGKSPIPTKAELDQEDFATVNPAFTVET